MDRQQLITTIVGTTLLGSALVMTARSDTVQTKDEETIVPLRIAVAAVEPARSGRTVRLPAVTRAADRAHLSFPIPARLATRPVEVGDRVRAGQTIAVLEDSEYRLAHRAAVASLSELEIRLDQALREAQRTAELAELEAATTEELERVRATASALEAARDAAAARVAETDRLLSESTLEAPFAGVVTAVHAEPGEWVAPGGPVVDLAGEGAVEVVVEAPESVWAHIAADQPATVTLPLIDREVSGTITRVASVSAGSGHLFPVEITLAEKPGVVAGLAAEVALPLASSDELTVPLKAVLNPGSSTPSVFRIVDGHAEQVPVEVGRMIGDRITVEARLAIDDLVAVAGHTALADNDRVEVE